MTDIQKPKNKICRIVKDTSSKVGATTGRSPVLLKLTKIMRSRQGKNRRFIG
jgi:hypothetical protein